MASGYFTTTKKGEIHEFKEELRSLDRPKKKEAVKKVIAAMTVGKDVSMLPGDHGREYLCQGHARPQPPHPRAAVRTMGCIRVDKITEYLCDPLQRCLKDDDPYVRKTAAVCVAKLFDINPEMVEDRGFLDMLRDMLSDANPMVVANALASLQEVQEVSGKDMLQMTPHTLFKLLAALNECTEWGQVFILDSLANYDTKDPKDAEKIVERVMPRLQHVNSAVVLSSVKVILRMMDVVANEDLVKAWTKKMAPPLVTLLSAEPEVQYVALRNIELIVQKRPAILANEVKVFFCKYNDPLYVKMEKLEVMIRLASDKNIDQVLLEFKEYAQEVDVDFVRKSVRAIGRCAVSIEKAAERCINVLLELIQSKVNYVVQEAVIVIKDIFRRYPNRYESIIATLCDNLDSLDEPEAKASMIWIIGEYAERIDNADELLDSFLETFPEETSLVQLQLLTATVKLFLKKPTESGQRMISQVLSAATNESDNPDLRDRAYIYWRLLSTDPEAAKEVVLADKPVISDDATALDPALLEVLLGQISSLASVYHKPVDSFVSRQRLAVQRADELEGHKFEEEDEAAAAAATAAAASTAPRRHGRPLGPHGRPRHHPSHPSYPAPSSDPFSDMFSTSPVQPPAAAAAAPPRLPLLVSTPGGVSVSGMLVRQAGQLLYSLAITNASPAPVDGFMLQTNKSSFGLAPANPVLPLAAVAAGATGTVLLPMLVDPAKLLQGAVSPALQAVMLSALEQPPGGDVVRFGAATGR
ncbi:MAG: hypothetical protein WDW38_007974 [Sanguina aurantia]